jgi:hypothetical protein
MEPLAFLQSKIENFPGYLDETARGRSDELVRSYLGEAIADLEARLTSIPPEVSDRIGALLLRAGFVDQAAYTTYESAARDGAPEERIADDDAAIVEVADRASQVDAAQLPGYLDDVTNALNRRDATMRSARP